MKSHLALPALILALAALAGATGLRAEGERVPLDDDGHPIVDAPAEKAPAKPRTTKPRAKAKPAPAPARLPTDVERALTPSEPVPYLSLPGVKPPVDTHAVTPTAAPLPQEVPYSAPTLTPVPATPQPALSQPAPHQSGPLPVAPVTPPPPVSQPATAQITLKCETLTSRGGRGLTRGTFMLHIQPSEVFADQADFRFSLIDPDHQSLIRRSLCLDLTCHMQVSPTTYYLVSQPDRKQPLRITLDRTGGAFSAETGKDGKRVTEQGWCRPAEKTRPIF